MKTILPILLSLILFTGATVEQSKHPVQENQRYPFENAIVDLVRTTTNPQFESEEKIRLFIRKHGMEEARYIEEVRNIKMLNTKQESSSHTIMTPEWLITIKDGKAHKVKNSGGDLLKGMSQEQMQQLAGGLVDGMDAKTENLGTKTVAGHECEVTKVTTNMAGMQMVMTQCNYQNLALELIGSQPGGTEYKEVVTNLEINPSNMPEEPFKIPEGIQVQTVNIDY